MEVTFTNLKGPATMPTLVQNYFTYYDVPISSVLLEIAIRLAHYLKMPVEDIFQVED